MYCSRCGGLIGEELNFCSRCGERANRNELVETSKNQNNVLDTLAITSIAIGAGGMLFFVGLIAILLDKNVGSQVLVTISIIYLAAWFGICAKLVGQISKVVDANLAERKSEKSRQQTQPVQISAPNTAQLEEYREPAMSVTENTTRTLDKIESKIYGF